MPIPPDSTVEMIIYLIRNRINGKVYVGKFFGLLPQRRWKRHISDARRGSTAHFHRAIRKYGVENFEIQVLSHASSKDELAKQEICFIQEYNSTDPKRGYNMTCGGDGGGPLIGPNRGKTASAETRAKQSAARAGKPLSMEHRLNIGKAQEGRKNPRIAAFNRVRTDLKGRKCTPKQLAALKAPKSKAHRKKIGEGRRAFLTANGATRYQGKFWPKERIRSHA